MTELEQLYFQDKRELTFKIAEALKEEDQVFLDKVNQEFSYHHHFKIEVSGVEYVEGYIQVDTLKEAEKYNSGELELYPEDVCWVNNNDAESIDVESINAKVYGLSLINPSPEAQALINSKQQ
jgi:hypothetical protein